MNKIIIASVLLGSSAAWAQAQSDPGQGITVVVPTATQPPSNDELQAAYVKCVAHRNPPPIDANGHPKSLPPSFDLGYQSGWEACTTIKAAVSADKVKARDAADQQSINDLAKRLNQ
jgi:hypothetical protein